jgi:hypothetical protein
MPEFPGWDMNLQLGLAFEIIQPPASGHAVAPSIAVTNRDDIAFRMWKAAKKAGPHRLNDGIMARNSNRA